MQISVKMDAVMLIVGDTALLLVSDGTLISLRSSDLKSGPSTERRAAHIFLIKCLQGSRQGDPTKSLTLSSEHFELLLLGFCYGLVCYRYYRSQVHLLPVVLVVRCAHIQVLCGECPSLLTVCVISEVDDSNGWLFSEAVAGCRVHRVWPAPALPILLGWTGHVNTDVDGITQLLR